MFVSFCKKGPDFIIIIIINVFQIFDLGAYFYDIKATWWRQKGFMEKNLAIVAKEEVLLQDNLKTTLLNI